MNKKHIISIVAAMVLSLSLFSGCASKNAMKDGEYKSEFSKADSKGWKAQLSIEVKDGKIVSSNYDYVNKDGKLKTQDETYNKKMEEKTKTNPIKYTEQLEKQLVEKQDPTKMDAVTGATTSSTNFKDLANAAIEKAKKGDTATAVIEEKVK